MSTRFSIDDAKALSAAERILLVEEIWDSIASTPENVPVTEAQREELDSRLDAYTKDSNAGADWSTARNRITKRT
jgi:putative addiction module component (TIGR02574 family)